MSQRELADYIQAFNIEHFLEDFKNDFDKRLELQKAIYLLQESGGDLGYHFSWYLRGPYSPSLADDAYSLFFTGKERFRITRGGISRIDPRVKDTFANILAEASKRSRNGKDESRWLEILSSVHYLMKHGYPHPTTKEEGIQYMLNLKGDRFSRHEVEEAYQILRKVGLL